MLKEELENAVKYGDTSCDIKCKVVNIIGPFFENRKQIEKFAGESQMLSAYHFFLKYKDDDVFAKGINSVLKFYRKTYKRYQEILWKALFATQPTNVENENKMSSLKGKKIEYEDNNLYEYAIQLFSVIESVLEISVKTILQEIYTLIFLEKQGSINYAEIPKNTFGYVVNAILQKGIFKSILVIEPNNLKLSDWRNIAAHRSFFVEKNSIICTLGKNQDRKIRFTRNELDMTYYYIERSANILNIARCIFVYDYMDYIPKISPRYQNNFRTKIRKEQLELELLAIGLKVKYVIDNDLNTEIDIFDINDEVTQNERINDCNRILIKLWEMSPKDDIYINFYSIMGIKTFRVHADYQTCKAILSGKKDISVIKENNDIIFY